MKRQFFLLIFMASLIFAQGKLSPLNPDFIEYMKNKTNDNTGGVIPAPIIIPKFQLNALSKPANLPVAYDLRDSNYVTSVKNQGICGSCWAFATMASVESNWLKNHDEYVDLSENNLKNRHSWEWGPCASGNYYISTSYFRNGKGPVYEIDDPYQEDNDYSDAFRPTKWLGNVRVLPAQRSYNDDELNGYFNLVKTYLMNHGALATTYYDDNSFISGGGNYTVIDGYTTYYEDEDIIENHGVTIIGWNDTIRTKAEKNGAWLIKNSWGTEFGEEGCFYISYYDKTINNLVCYWPERKDYKFANYSYGLDETGVGHFWGNEVDSIGYVLMKAELWNQTLSQISTYNYFPQGNLYVEIYDDFIDGKLTGLLTSGQRVNLELTGAYTVAMDSVIEVKDKNDIFVKVTYDLSESGMLYPIPIEKGLEGIRDPVISQGFFWTSFDGENWDNSLDEYCDPCIKLFGEFTGLQPDLSISKRNLKIGESVTFKDISKGAEEITSWQWNFGDGNESVEQNPVHTYDSTGVYDVSLIVTSENFKDTLLLPRAVIVDNAYLINPSQISRQNTLQPNFQWNDTGIPSFQDYQLTIGSSATLQQDTLSYSLHDTTVLAIEDSLSDNAIYYWTVTAYDSSGMSIPYDTLSFAVDLMAEAPSDFALKFPGSDAVGLGEVLSFIWEESTDNDPWDEVMYAMRIGADVIFDTLVFEADSIDETHFVMSTPLENNKKYYWQVLARDLTGNTTASVTDSFTVGSITAIDDHRLPGKFHLGRNYPNPFNPATSIQYSLKEKSLVKLTIYNALGKRISQLVNTYQPEGYYQVDWNAAERSSGIYFYKLECHGTNGQLQYQNIRKMLFLK